MRNLALAAMAAIALSACAERTPEQRAAAAAILSGGLLNFSSQQRAMAMQPRPMPVTCIPMNRYAPGGGFSCY